MKLNPTNRKWLVHWGIPAGLLAALFLYVSRYAPLATRIVGSWPTSNLDQTTVTTFKPNGEFEMVATYKRDVLNSDGSGLGIPTVFKGHYSIGIRTFRTFDIKRYARINGYDRPWMPSADCVRSNTCVSDAETMQMDQEASNPKHFSTIISADWWKGEMRVRWSDDGKIDTWKRQ